MKYWATVIFLSFVLTGCGAGNNSDSIQKIDGVYMKPETQQPIELAVSQYKKELAKKYDDEESIKCFYKIKDINSDEDQNKLVRCYANSETPFIASIDKIKTETNKIDISPLRKDCKNTLVNFKLFLASYHKLLTTMQEDMFAYSKIKKHKENELGKFNVYAKQMRQMEQKFLDSHGAFKNECYSI